MYTILKKRVLNPLVEEMDIHAPYVVSGYQPGQFLILRVNEEGERIPLTIVDCDRQQQSVRIIYQVVGYSTTLLSRLQAGDAVHDVLGPLGQPAELEHLAPAGGRVLGIGGGVGAAPLYPQLRALAERGVKTEAILGGRSDENIILREEFGAFCENVHLATDDGSVGRKGFVTDVLKDLLNDKYDAVIAIGPLVMMKAVCAITGPAGIPTSVSLNPIMIDGTGMCGGCRVTVEGQTKFACVDGPDFDGHQVDFDECIRRQAAYRDEEHVCRLSLHIEK